MSKHRKSIIYSQASLANSRTSTPSPTDFEHFVPWMCRTLQANVVVIKTTKDDGEHHKRSSTSKSRRSVHKSNTPGNSIKMSPLSLTLHTINKIEAKLPNPVPIHAIYNKDNKLLEIVIINCPWTKQVIKSISVCLPFHLLLNKLTLKTDGMNCGIAYELSKLLECSNITDLCLDDTQIAEGNYYMLIQSNLKILSLKRCNINDIVCEIIRKKLVLLSTSLVALNLASNRITDAGVIAIGNALKKNRTLLHLDISGNGITDDGVTDMLKKLAEFPLSPEEVIEDRGNKINYFVKKMQNECKEQVDIKLFDNKENICCNRQTVKCIDLKEGMPSPRKGMDIKAEAKITYEKKDLIYKNDQMFNIGNLKLCSLNLAYNNLGSYVLHKICCVLKYQLNLQKETNATGLLRVVLDGNNISYCKEFDKMKEYLKQAADNVIASNLVDKNVSNSSQVSRKNRNK